MRFNRSVWTIVCALIAFVLVPSTANSEPPPLKVYGDLAQVIDAEISPDGEHFALIYNLDGKPVLVVMSKEGKVVKTVGLGDLKARHVSFYDNENVILRLSETTRTRGFRGKYENSASFRIALNGDDIIQLPRSVEGLYPAQSGLGRIIGAADREGWVLMPAFMGGRYDEPRYSLLRVSLRNGRGRVVSKGNQDGCDWFSDGQGNPIYRERYDNQRNRYRVEHFDGKWNTIYDKESKLIPISIRGVLPDLSGVVFVSANQGDGGFDSLMVLRSDGSIDGPLLSAPDKEIHRVLTDSSRVVVGVRYAGMVPEYDFFDEVLSNAYDAMQAALPYATIYIDSWAEDRSKVLYRVFEPSVGDIWLQQTVADNSIMMLTNNRPDLPAEAIGNLYSITYPARDGLEIPAIVTTPKNKPLDALSQEPLIVLPHGGPASYDAFDFDWMPQFFASRGYTVLQPNFRGSSGFGRTFERAGDGEWGKKMQHDITDGVQAFIDSGRVDPNRVCIIGASYGGYAALAGAAFTPDLYQCVVAIAPVSDLRKMLVEEKRDHGRDHWVISSWERRMVDGDTQRAAFDAISPAKHAKNVTAPVLLLHGKDDTVVDINQSRTMESALKRADKIVDFVILRGEDHWLTRSETRLQTLTAIDRFLSEHLPVGEIEAISPD